ncbi:MAG: biopolymer transporter ExbD [Myxococcaceae bacterium]|nr:biopolymer transporter ExbD [Myxococcaceae bacterium]
MNVTPLVDVVLVLLIIFMVVTPQMEAGVTVKLPSISNPDQGNGSLEPITVTVAADGALYLEKERLAHDALMTQLDGLHRANAERRVVLKADTTLRYVKVRELFKDCQSVGFPGVSLQVLDLANSKS